MTTVTGKLIGAANPQRVEMKATLVDVTGKDAVGYVASVPGELVKPVTIVAEGDGDWTVDLTPNSLITSDSGDTVWAIQEGRRADGTPIRTYVVVPATGGPYWAGNIRADLSDTTTGGGTVVYLPGPPGPQGATGAQGGPGPAGVDGEDGAPGAPGAAGAAGASAYQVAVAGGFTGTEAEWLATLVGPQGEPGPEGPQPPLGAAGAGDSIALRSTDASTTNARTPTAHAASHADGGSDELTLAQDQITGLAAALGGKLPVTGGTVTGGLTVEGYTTLQGGQFNSDVAAFGDLQLIGSGKRYRLRRSGEQLDFEGGGVDLLLSVWSDDEFTETQHGYLRFSADAQNTQLAGPLESVAALYGPAVHKLDPATGVAAVGAKNGAGNIRLCGFLPTAGAPTTGAWTAGDVLLDSAGAWWLCTASGTPGTWTGGGSTAPSIRTNDIRITAGDVALATNASWTVVTSGATQLACPIAAAAGDRLLVDPTFMRTGSGSFLDLAILKGDGSISRYLGSGTATPLLEGNPAYYPQEASFPGEPGTMQIIVASDEINGSGQAKVALVYKGTSGETVYASATYPFYMLLTNLGPQPA